MRGGLEPERGRLCEVKCVTTGGYGTGYLLNGGLVLTAAHVLDAGRKVPKRAALDIQVRRQRDHDKGPGPAVLEWPPLDRFGADRQPDVAVLRIREAEAFPPVPMGLGDLEGNGELDAVAVGYPESQKAKSGQRGTRPVRGTVDPLAWTVEELFELVSSRRLPEDEWQGLSGAPLFAEGRFIGVMRTREHGAFADFKAVRLDPVRERFQEFEVLLRDAATFEAAPSMEARLPDIAPWVCLLARDWQEQEFRVAHGPPPWPGAMCCFIVGPKRHLPEQMLYRIARRTLPEDLDWPRTPMARFETIAWPPRAKNPALAMTILRESLWNLLCRKAPAPVDPAPYADALGDGSAQRLFYSELPAAALQDPGHAALIAMWARFWAAIAPTGARRPVHAILVPEATEDAVSEWIVSIPDLAERGQCLAELPLCTGAELTTWLDQRLPSRFRREHAPAIGEWGVLLRSRLGAKEFDLQSVIEEVASMAAARG